MIRTRRRISCNRTRKSYAILYQRSWQREAAREAAASVAQLVAGPDPFIEYIKALLAS